MITNIQPLLMESTFLGLDTSNVNPVLLVAIIIVAGLIAVVSAVSVGVSIWLAVKYVKFNRRQNSAGITGSDAARKILDDNGLQKIRVSVVGSVLFGNSYSHWFKKIRLRRLTNKKTSITSLAMGAQKSCLAILDKENDPDMRQRVRLIPLITFGPFAFIPLLAVGVALDILVFNTTGVATIVCAGLGILFYVLSFILSIKVYKTEIKAQERAYIVLKEERLATDEEIELMKELFKLYNIQYINDMILAFLQVLLKILLLIAKAQMRSSASSSD